MKLRLFFLFISINSGLAFAQQPYSPFVKVNYIRVWEAAAPEQNPAVLVTRPLRDVKQTTSFFDGLGRPLQSVVKQGSFPTGAPGGVDMVNPMVYDEYGREQFKHLPFAANNTGGNSSISDGQFKRNPFQQQPVFMQQQYGGQGETYFYARTVFEPSPLNRVQEQFPAGSNWAGTAGNLLENDRRSVKTKYWFNTAADDVKKWTASTVAFSLGSYSMAGAYGARELFKKVTVNEHGKQEIEFKDKDGKVILKKVQLTASADLGTGSGYPGWLCTYYIYDERNNLRCVIQPEAVKQMANSGNWSPDANMLAELCFQYAFDERSRMIIKKLPGSGEVHMIYDRWDRLILSQDGNMRAGNFWVFTKYDQFNRPVMTGIHWDGIHPGIVAMNTHVKENESWLIRYEVSDLTKPHGYTTTQTYPYGTSPNVLTVTYYDNYDWVMVAGGTISTTFNTADFNPNNFITTYNTAPYYAEEMLQSGENTGQITGTKTRVLETSGFLFTSNIYDKKGRMIQAHSTNLSGGKDIVTTQYNFNGQPIRTVTRHQKSGGNDQLHIILNKLEYDDLGRLVSVKKTVNSALPGGVNISKPEIEIVKNTYDAAGLLSNKSLGQQKDVSGTYIAVPIETLTYEYNIRGWLLGVNRSYLSDAGTGKYFGFELGYDKLNNSANRNFALAQFNGNINGMVWKSTGDGIQRKYDFVYDPANRLLKGDFEQHNTDNSWNNTQVNYNVKMGDGSDATSAYDANGNIQRMQQWGLKITGSTQIDDMSYSYYTNTNKLSAVGEQGPGAQEHKLSDFTDKNTGSNDYGYDASGNIITDLNKRLNGTTGNNLSSGGAITYNHLNLPLMVTVKKDDGSPRGNIVYTYDAAGNKLKKVTTDQTVAGKSVVTTTLYIGGSVYESRVTTPADAGDYTDRLLYIMHEEGRLRFTPAAGSNGPRFDYDYYIKDHLGNVRMVLTDEQRTDIYQAGMETADRSFEVFLFGDKVNSTAQAKPGGFDAISGNQQVSRVNGTTAEGRVGPGVILKVMAGDKIKALTQAWYQPTGMDNTTDPLLQSIVLNILGQLTPGVSNAGKGTAAEQITNSILQPGMQSLLNNQAPASGAPKAYLNWVLFDEEQFKMVSASSGFVPVPQITGSQQKQLLQANSGNEIEMKKNGYLYVYVSNESKGNVYFDDIRVEHKRGALSEETHYYPFGLTMAGISSKSLKFADPANRNKFNGIEETREMDLNQYDAFFRTADPQTGRWWQADPKPTPSHSPYSMMGNNPILNSDFLGDTLKIHHRKKDYTYVDGKLYNADGTEYTGKARGFLKQTKQALDLIRKKEGGEGRKAVNQLQSSKNNFTIKDAVAENQRNHFAPDNWNNAQATVLINHLGHNMDPNKPFDAFGSGGTIYFDPAGTTINGTYFSPEILLSHEMGHAIDGDNGQLDQRSIQEIDGKCCDVNSEIRAVWMQNTVAQELGRKNEIRMHISSNPDEKTPVLMKDGKPVYVPPTPVKIFPIRLTPIF